MHKTWIAILVLLGVLVPRTYADSGSALYERGRARYLSARNLKGFQVKRNAYARAAGELKQFLELHPRHSSADAARFEIGSMYQELAEVNGDREDAGQALHYYRDLVRFAPKDPLADNALSGIASICEKVFQDLRCRDEAQAKIRRDHPSGDIALNLEPTPTAAELTPPAKRSELLRADLAQEASGFVLKVELDAPVTVTPRYLGADPSAGLPDRYYIDIQNAHLPRTMQPPKVPENAPVSRIRFGQNTLATVRIVLDLSPGVSTSDISAQEDGKTILIRIGPPVSPPATPEAVAQATAVPTEAPKKTLTTQPTVPQKLRIVIDPGHGGEDAGAKGTRGTLEKDITLAIAKKLAALLSRSPHYEVFMTRTEDRKLGLGDRTSYANRVNGDLFVSIHANAATRHSVRGVSTYFLDNADDAESLRVAMLENGELAAPRTGDQGKSEDYYLEIMKASMIKNFHTTQSTDLARNVQTSLVTALRTARLDIDDLGVRSAGFYVLTGAKMPAILVETSFLSNPTEEKRLRDPKYQEKLSQAIFQGIERFFKARAAELNHASLYHQ